MSIRLLSLVFVIVAFAALTAMALLDVGYFGIFEPHLTTWAGAQVFVDLVIVCALAIIWMVRDARESGATVWPFIVLTLAAGAFGPLFYLLVRELRSPAGQSGTAAQSAVTG